MSKEMQEVKKYLSEIGRKGGKVKGFAKVRGGSEYYREISRKGVAARRAKKKSID